MFGGLNYDFTKRPRADNFTDNTKLRLTFSTFYVFFDSFDVFTAMACWMKDISDTPTGP